MAVGSCGPEISVYMEEKGEDVEKRGGGEGGEGREREGDGSGGEGSGRESNRRIDLSETALHRVTFSFPPLYFFNFFANCLEDLLPSHSCSLTADHTCPLPLVLSAIILLVNSFHLQ